MSGVDPFPLHEGLVRYSTATHRSRPIHIPAVLRSTRDYPVQFFLSFHQENINEFHYFCYHDYRKFCTTTLMTMVQQSDALAMQSLHFSTHILDQKRPVRQSASVLVLRISVTAASNTAKSDYHECR